MSNKSNNQVQIVGHEYLINSIKQQINNDYFLESTNEEEIFLLTNKIKIFSLIDYCQNHQNNNKYNSTKRLITTLTRQLEYLIEECHVTFYEYRKENVFVFIQNKKYMEQEADINDYIEEDEDEDEEDENNKQEILHFLYISNDFLPINEKHNILFSKPFNRENNNIFFSPEIRNIKQLPQEIHYKTIYYSLGTLSLFFYLDDNNKTIHEALQCIQFTKLYWLIKRSLHILPERRSILYL